MHIYVARSLLDRSGCALEALHREWQDRLLCKTSRDGSEFFELKQEGIVARLLSKHTLKRWWGIRGPIELLQTLEQLLDESSTSPYPAWDISRGLNRVIGYGLQCRYLTVQEARPYWSRAVRIAKRSYDGWEEYGRAVIEGRFHWSNDGQDYAFRQAMQRLLIHPASPWRKLTWSQLNDFDH